MAEDFPPTTMICMFHTSDLAQASVRDLLELGLSETEIAVVGDARTEITGSTPTSTLQAMRVPEGDMSMLMDGLRDGGTIVAVMAPELLTSRIEDIFKKHSADKVDEKVIETNTTDHFSNESSFNTVETNRLDSENAEDTTEPIDPIDPLNRV